MIKKNTLVLHNILLNRKELTEAAGIIKRGGLVVFPTETVYGLGADAFNPDAVRKIFEAKGRPPDNPLIVHLSGAGDLHLAAPDVPEAAVYLFNIFSPGPITLVLKKDPHISGIVTAGLETVAVRIPSNASARAFIKECGVPIAAPSANISGRPSPTTFGMAMSGMNGRADAIIDGGDCEIGLESTVISVHGGSLRILRPGAVTMEMVLEAISVFPGYRLAGTAGGSAKPRSPGMKYSHYKPSAEVFMAFSIDPGRIRMDFPGMRIGIIMIEDGEKEIEDLEVISFRDAAEYAKGLYKSFEELDGKGCDIIVAQAVEPEGIGRAVMNRLEKASGGKYVP